MIEMRSKKILKVTFLRESIFLLFFCFRSLLLLLFVVLVSSSYHLQLIVLGVLGSFSQKAKKKFKYSRDAAQEESQEGRTGGK